MKKRLLSLLLVLAVVFSFSLSAFATDTGIDIIDDPLSYYFENQMLGVQKGTGVTLVCPKCDYKVVYTGGTLVTCPYDGEALVLADLAGVHAEKVPPLASAAKTFPATSTIPVRPTSAKRESSNLWLILAGLMLVNKNRINLL